MSRQNPYRGERYVWNATTSGLGEVFLIVKTPMIHGKQPRVRFTCFTRYASWEKTQPFPLSERFEQRDWTDADLRTES